MSASGLNEVSTIHTSGSSITTDTVRASTVYSVFIGHVRRAAGGSTRARDVAALSSGASVAVAVFISSAPPGGGSRTAGAC